MNLTSFLTAWAWSLPLIAVGASLVGVALSRLRARGPTKRATRLLIAQVTTKGDAAAAAEVIAAIHAMPARVTREVWVVVEEGSAARFPTADRVLTVPAGFECKARAKGRALEWARRVRAAERLDAPDVKVLLLDDDSVPSERYLRLCEQTDADIAQGIVAPRRHYGRLLSHLDDLRPLHCLAICSWAQARGRPVHVHGEGLCVRASAERVVGWNVAGSQLAEDLVFGQRASALGLRWAFLPAVIGNTSPWSARAFVTQRRRWTWGTIEAMGVIPWRARLRVVAAYVVTLGGFAASLAGTAIGLLTGEVPAGPWTASLACWLGLFALSGWISSCGSMFHALAATLLAWLTALANALVIPLVLLAGAPRAFQTIHKLPPAPTMRLRTRIPGIVRVVGAASVGLIGLLAFAVSSATLPAKPSGAGSWVSDAEGGLLRAADGPAPRAGEIRTERRAVVAAGKPVLTRFISVIAYGNDPFFGHKAGRLLDKLERLGITHVSLTVPIFTDGVYANSVQLDPELTPSSSRIEAFAAAAHRRGMTAGLNPLLDEASLASSGAWRGSLTPLDRGVWFRSYTGVIARFARLAERAGFQSLSIGTELETLLTDDRWRWVLTAARERFQGTISYAMAGSRVLDAEGAWLLDRVDQIGINAWYEADLPDGAATKEIAAALAPWQRSIRRFREAIGAPIVFTEAGAPSHSGSDRQPTLVNADSAPDPVAQARTYEAVCELARGVGSDGVIWWATTLDPPPRPRSDRGYDPIGKPATEVIRDCRFG